MNVFFCDLCNESIPQADLDLGRAVRRNERLICAACEAAMSGGAPLAAPAPVAPPPVVAPRPAPPAQSSSLAAVALALAFVALVAAVGAGSYLYWKLEERTAALDQRVADAARAAPEHARTVSTALGEESRARETEISEARTELTALSARVAELERASEGTAALQRRVEKLDERSGVLDDLLSRVDHQAGVLEQLSTTVAQMAAARMRAPDPTTSTPANTPTGTPAKADPVRPAEAAPNAVPAKDAQWRRWVSELTSPDSSTRWQAVQTLGQSKDPEVVPHLIPMLDDADIFVRMAACRHLGDLGSVTAIPALIDTLEDEEAAVREAALVALQTLAGQSIAFDPGAREGDRAKRVKAWREWWDQASKEQAGAKPKAKN